MNLSLILCKILNRLGLLHWVNIPVKIQVRAKEFIIPINGRMGFEHLYLFEDHDFRVYEFFINEIKKGCFIDIGANTGQTIIKVKALAHTQIISIEPNSTCVSYLQEFKAMNQLGELTIIPAAIFDQSGIKKLHLLDKRDTGASLVEVDRPNYFREEQFILVNAITGESLPFLLTQQCSFMKIDVEGAELNVLTSLQYLIERDKPIIYCEVLDAHNDSVLKMNSVNKERIYSFLTAINYKVFRLDEAEQKLVPVKQFPLQIFESKNLDNCNYIFMP